MTQGFADGLIWPAAALALLGWLVPRGLSLVFPEGVRPLLLLALASALIMTAVSTAAFVALYVQGGAPLALLLEPGPAQVLIHFGRLGLASALIWAPIMILSVAGLPKHWVRETW